MRFLLLNIIVLMATCNNHHSSNKDILTSNPVPSQPASVHGVWTYNFPFYSSELIIDTGGTFKFHNQGCTGQGYSEGNWKLYGDILVLTSFDKYKEVQQSVVTVIETKPIQAPYKKKKKGGQKTLYFDTSLDHIYSSLHTSTFSFKYPDTSNIYFDQIIYRLRGDTLYQIDKEGLYTSEKSYKMFFIRPS
jgi:hypothetical protein